MPVANIVDNRSNQYDVTVDVVLELSSHNNSIKGATQFSKSKNKFTIDDLNKTTIEDAINHVNQKFKNDAITLYLYDAGSSPAEDYEDIFDLT